MQVEDLLKAADALMSQLGSAASVTSVSVTSASEKEDGEEPPSIMKLQCDVHGTLPRVWQSHSGVQR